MSQNQKPTKLTTVDVEPLSHEESEFSKWGKKLERLAQAGVKQEIVKHKAAGQPIYYTLEDKPEVMIVELPDGRCFEYRILEDTREIVREIHQ